MKVIQAVNTQDYDSIDGLSCIAYWKRENPYSADPIRYCRATLAPATPQDAIVGGHVIGIKNGTPHVYITPILNSVNASGNPEIFGVDERDLVRVPDEHEQAILADNDNRHKRSMLEEIERMNELMSQKCG